MCSHKFRKQPWQSLLALAVILISAPLTAPAQQGASLAIVSATNSSASIAPGALATIYGQNLALMAVGARLDASGALPTSINGTSVLVNGETSALLYVSPGQINFAVPSDALLGSATVTVTSPLSQTAMTGTAMVALVSPGLFTIPCLRPGRGAVENGVTYSLEPFQTTTNENGSADKRTRLSLFGTGLRYSGNSTRDASFSNVAGAVTANATDSYGFTRQLQVEYAGVAPYYFGLDQVNLVLPAELENAGLVTLGVHAGGIDSNAVSVVLSNSLASSAETNGDFSIMSVAGTGQQGSGGDGSAIGTMLNRPQGIALDSQHNLYIASPAAHIVQRISTDGSIATVAGTGTAGSSGDGGTASQAQLQAPSGLAVDSGGNLYIADPADHKIRRVQTDGTISTYAGTGVSGFSGDGGIATDAQLSSPAAIALDRYGALIVADTGNNRVRKVTADGMIETLAGGGTGSGQDGGEAYLAVLNAPDSVAAGADGTIYFAESSNHMIRRINPDGTIQTIAGNGPNSLQPTVSFQGSLSLALDNDQRLFVSDSQNARIQLMGESCQFSSIAGTGVSSFSGDGGSAVLADLNGPAALAVDPAGDVYFSDSNNNRVRKLYPGDCQSSPVVRFDPSAVVAGMTVTGTVHLACPALQNTTLALNSTLPSLAVPASVTIPSGQGDGTFSFVAPGVDSAQSSTVTASGNQYSATGTLVIEPNGNPKALSLAFQPASPVGGGPLTGVVTLGAPASAGGVVIRLGSNNSAANVAPSVTVPAGQLGAEFSVATSPVPSNTQATITASAGPMTVNGDVLIQAPNQLTIALLAVSPSIVTGGQTATGTVMLDSAAPNGGIQVNLSSSSSAAVVPASVVVPSGQATATFSISTAAVPSATPAAISASSANSVSTTIEVLPPSVDLPSAAISSLSVSPNTVTAGQSASGTVVIESPAPAGGAQITLATSSSAANVPVSVTVPSGQSSVAFSIATTSVPSPTAVMITASSANSMSTTLEVLPATEATSGVIGSLTLSPPTVTAGQTSTGAVTLQSPAPANGLSLALASNSPAASVPSSVTVGSGQTSAFFPISTSPVASSTTATITASSANTVSATLTLNPQPSSPQPSTIASFSVSPSTVTGGASATGTVVLNSVAPASGVQVSLLSNNSSATVPNSVTVSAGQTTATFPVATTSPSSSQTATITASAANTASATLTINPSSNSSSPCVGSVTFSSGSVVGGDPVNGSVGLTGPAPSGGQAVSLSSSSSSASVPTTVTVPAGQNSAGFTVTTSPVSALTTPLISANTGACATSTGSFTLIPSIGGLLP